MPVNVERRRPHTREHVREATLQTLLIVMGSFLSLASIVALLVLAGGA
jgi:hypothetical protein